MKRGKIFEPNIRVLISFEEDTFSLKGYFTLSQKDKKIEIRDRLIKVKENKVYLKDSLLFDLEKEPVIITPYPHTYLHFRDKAYRGYFKIVYGAVWKYKKPCLINILPLEEYLFSVVSCEIGPIDEKNYESAKAQAVAARSYALFRMLQNQKKIYDIFASPILDQAYEGKKKETFLTTKAVKETKGEILINSGRIFKAMYHANCGGLLYSGKRDSEKYSLHKPPFCKYSKNYKWEKSLEKDDLVNILKKIINYQKKKPLRIKKIKLEKERKSQRVKKIRFYTNAGIFYLTGEKFRSLLDLKSRLLEIKMRGDKIKILGYGYGHGKGMCQDGAMAMAKKGYNYKEILSHYYPKKKIKKIY
ncbi:MAG: SpoIID/LytB domain-containing protein [candidate division WOR-3 bacterium]|nr:SpoIID/LytB domain-containing protein [candidate division WOR-3 bacterium]MDW8113752.1 SpoIID/LytB domain-containing protein [candidate division WOR-3 bacterium]